MLSLAYPTWDLPAMLWLWMFPFLASLWLGESRRPGKRRLFLLGWLAGFAFFFPVLRWLQDIHGAGPVLSILGWTALSAYLACFFGVWAVFAGTVGRLERARMLTPEPVASPRIPGFLPGPKALATAPAIFTIRQAGLNAAAWVALEWLRGWLLGGFGWNGLGVALHENLPLAQAAEFTGVAGLSFLPVFVSICLFATVWRIHLRLSGGAKRATLNLDFSAAMAMLVVVFLFGWTSILRQSRASQAGSTLEIAIVQRNIPQDLKWDPTRAMQHVQGYYDAFVAAMKKRDDARTQAIEQAMRQGGEISVSLAAPEIILLPESALPLYLADPNVEEFRAAILDVAGGGASLVTGIDDAEMGNPPRFFNTIAVLPAGDVPPVTYRKMNLVPFGEYLPMRWFPPMRWLAGAAVPGDFEAGTSTDPLRVDAPSGPLELIPLICFEDTLGRHARRFARGSLPQILANATNDGWFDHPAAALQHAANAKFRCIELRRPMVRAANTGLSCLIDPCGKVLAEIRHPETGSPQTADVLFASLSVAARPPMTMYARFGDLFALLCGVIALSPLALRRLRKK